jgi:hypothetical protein
MNSTILFKNDTSFYYSQLSSELDLIEFYLKICEKLLKIYPIALLTIGTLGNLISFIVLMYGSRKKSTTFSYLSCLALIDLAVIATFTIHFISLYNFDKDLQDNIVYCKLYAFLVYYLPQYSAWTLSVVSVDRMIALLQVNITHRFEGAAVKGAVENRRHLTIRDRLRKINRQTSSTVTTNENSCCFFDYFCKKRQKKPGTATTSATAASIIANKKKIKKKFCLTKCFNSIFSLYSFRISEKYRAFFIVGVIGILLFLLNSHFLFIYDNTKSSSSENFYNNQSFYDDDDKLLSILYLNARNFTLNSSNINNLNTVEHLLRRQKISDSSVLILLNGVNVIKCSLEHNQKYKQFYQVWVHIDSIVNVYLPFAVMIISSFTIIMCVLKSMKAAGNYRYHKIARNISIMLVSLNVLFIALTAPIVIQLAIDAASSGLTAQNITLPMEKMQWKSLYSEEPHIMLSETVKFNNISEENKFYRNVNKEIIIIAKKRLIKLICIIIMNSNHATNIMVYCLIGREFRRHFMCAIRRFIYGDSKYKQFYLANPQYKKNNNIKMSMRAKKLEDGECVISATSSNAKHLSSANIANKTNKRLNLNNQPSCEGISQIQFENSQLKESEF